MKEPLELVLECRVGWLWVAAAAYLVSHRLGDRLVRKAVTARPVPPARIEPQGKRCSCAGVCIGSAATAMGRRCRLADYRTGRA